MIGVSFLFANQGDEVPLPYDDLAPSHTTQYQTQYTEGLVTSQSLVSEGFVWGQDYGVYTWNENPAIFSLTTKTWNEEWT